MTFGVYAIRDVKSGFMSPAVEVNNEVAIRNFSYAVRHNEMFDTFASDYSFYRIGDFDSDTGVLTPYTPPVFLLEARAAAPKVLNSGGLDDVR